MDFYIENDEPLLEMIVIFKMGGRANWDCLLGNLDIPMEITNVI